MAYYTDERKYFDEFSMHGGRQEKILFQSNSWFSIPDIEEIPDSALLGVHYWGRSALSFERESSPPRSVTQSLIERHLGGGGGGFPGGGGG